MSTSKYWKQMADYRTGKRKTKPKMPFHVRKKIDFAKKHSKRRKKGTRIRSGDRGAWIRV